MSYGGIVDRHQHQQLCPDLTCSARCRCAFSTLLSSLLALHRSARVLDVRTARECERATLRCELGSAQGSNVLDLTLCRRCLRLDGYLRVHMSLSLQTYKRARRLSIHTCLQERLYCSKAIPVRVTPSKMRNGIASRLIVDSSIATHSMLIAAQKHFATLSRYFRMNDTRA